MKYPIVAGHGVPSLRLLVAILRNERAIRDGRARDVNRLAERSTDQIADPRDLARFAAAHEGRTPIEQAGHEWPECARANEILGVTPRRSPEPGG